MTPEVFWYGRRLTFDKAVYLRIAEELVNIDLRDGRVSTQVTGDFFETLDASFVVDSALTHWSRRFEWPWALSTAVDRRDIVLDAGGGAGAFQFYLARRAAAVVNLDASQAMLDRTEQIARQTDQHNLLCRHGDLAQIPYPDGHFTKVFCISVVEHTADPARCLEELWRVLAPGGQLVLTLDVAQPANPHCHLDLNGACALLAQRGWSVPEMRTDVIIKRYEDAPSYNLAVLCLRATKGAI